MKNCTRNLKGKSCFVVKIYCFVQCRCFTVINFKSQKGDFAGYCPIYNIIIIIIIIILLLLLIHIGLIQYKHDTDT